MASAHRVFHYLLNSTPTVMTNHILGLSKTNYTNYTPVALLFNEHATLAATYWQPRGASDLALVKE